MSRAQPLRERLPLHAGMLGPVVAAALTLACAEFVRSGLYGAYLTQAGGTLLGLSKEDAVAVAATAFTIHFISDTLMRSPAGALITRCGVRPVMLWGAALSLAAVALFSVSQTGWTLLLVAALHGVGFSPMWPAVMSLTASAAHETHQGRVLTAVTMSVMPLIGAGFLVMGALGKTPVGLVFTLMLGLLTVSLLSTLLLPRTLRVTPAAPAARPAAKAARLQQALRALAPLIPAALLQTLTLTLLGPLLFTLTDELGVSYLGMVALLVTGGAAAFGSMPLTGKLADGGHARLAVTLGFALISLGLGGFASQPPYWVLFPLAAVVGIGYAFMVPGWAALVARRLPEAERPAAWGALMTVENVGTSLGPLLGAFAYRQFGTSGPFIFGAVMAGLTAVGYLLFRHLFDTPPLAESASGQQESAG